MSKQVTYTATREIIDAHVLDEVVVYSLEGILTQLDRSYRLQRTVKRSISNVNMLTYQHEAIQYRCRTRPMTQTEALQMREFLRSVKDQVFLFSPGDDYESPPVDYDCIITRDDGERRARTGDGVDRFVFGWTVELVG